MCSCNKSTPPVGTNARAKNTQAQAASDRAAAVAAARAANPSTTRMGPVAAAGVTQTFSLGDQTFGSKLERDAYLARHGR